MILKIKKLDNCFKIPEYKTDLASGMDLYSANYNEVLIKPLKRALIPTGIKIELEKGYEAQIRARSGLAIKNGITLINAIGTIDADYRGEICVGLVNLSDEDFVVKRGDRIAQMVIAPVIFPSVKIEDNLSETERSEGGFGSTGV